MAEVTINYKDAAIATMDASGTKTLQTQGKYCEDDIEIVYARPSGGNANVLLSSFLAEQDINTIQLSGDISGYDLYLIELVGSTNATEWIYPEFNGIANTGYYFAPRNGAMNWNAVIPLICGAQGTPQFTDGTRIACPAFSSGGVNIFAPLDTGVLTSLAFHLYNTQNVFKAGFTVKLWGVPLSTT